MRDPYEVLRIEIGYLQIKEILAIFGQGDCAFDQLLKEKKRTPPADLRTAPEVGSTAREKPKQKLKLKTRISFGVRERSMRGVLALLLGAPFRTGPAHVMTLGPIGVARDLKQPLPARDDGVQAMAERCGGVEERDQHGGAP